MNNRKYHTDPEELLRQGKEIMSSTDDVRFHFRVFSVNMVLSGLPASQISKLAGVSKMTVSSWVKIDDEKGFDALKLKGHKGRPSKLTDGQLKEIKQILTSEPKQYGYNVWHDVLRAYAKQFNITKLKWIVSGGDSGQESIRNGVYNLEGKASADDIIVIHDGIRPLVDASVLTDVLLKAKKYGNAVTSLPYNEQIFIINKEDETTTKEYIPRETLRRVSTPQAYRFDMLDKRYHEAFEQGIGIYGSSYTNTMMVELGETLHFAAGSDKNIKLTTKDDLELFKAYLKADKDSWLK